MMSPMMGRYNSLRALTCKQGLLRAHHPVISSTALIIISLSHKTCGKIKQYLICDTPLGKVVPSVTLREATPGQVSSVGGLYLRLKI